MIYRGRVSDEAHHDFGAWWNPLAWFYRWWWKGGMVENNDPPVIEERDDR